MKKSIKYLTTIAKIFGFIASLSVVPFVPPHVGVIIVLAASTLKDTLINIADVLDDGQKNNSVF